GTNRSALSRYLAVPGAGGGRGWARRTAARNRHEVGAGPSRTPRYRGHPAGGWGRGTGPTRCAGRPAHDARSAATLCEEDGGRRCKIVTAAAPPLRLPDR